jgi:erythromycin esterase-like protein
MKISALIFMLCWCTAVSGALPGVVELGRTPQNITDKTLSSVLAARLRSADVIAIGESVHGSSGMLRVQTRLIRHLVEHQGLRLIVWENPVLRSLELSRWVSSCTRATSPPPIDVLYMPTAADLPLWQWVCQYNRDHPSQPIRFRGMDVWDRPWEHHARIESLAAGSGIDTRNVDGIKRDCPAYGMTSWPQIEHLYAQVQQARGFAPAADYARCRAALIAIVNAAQQRGRALRSQGLAAADDAYELALSASTLLGWLGFYHHYWSDDVASWNERDRAQGRNLALIMEQQGAARAILSAHTSHVSHNRSPANWWGYGDLKSGVHFFQAMTGRKVFSIALTAYRASGTQGEWLLPTAANSMDRLLHEAGHRLSYFPADAAFLARHRRWWMQNGNASGMENGIELAPADHFDAFIFLDHSPLERELPARPMWQY